MAEGDQSGPGSMIDDGNQGNDAKMFIGGLSRSTTQESLKAYFEQFGEVRDAVVKIDQQTGQSRGFGFVMFVNEASIDAVVQQHAHELDGKKIDPKKAERRDGKMFVGGVKPETDDEVVRAYFSQYGEVEEVIRPINKDKGENKPFCFVTFKKDGIMGKCVKERFHDIDGKKCECKNSLPKEKMAAMRGGYGGGYGVASRADTAEDMVAVMVGDTEVPRAATEAASRADMAEALEDLKVMVEEMGDMVADMEAAEVVAVAVGPAVVEEVVAVGDAVADKNTPLTKHCHGPILSR